MRRITLIALCATAGLALASDFRQVERPRTVNLDKPGVLEQIEKDNPGHFARIEGIRKVASHTPCQMERLAKTLKADFDASATNCAQFFQASYPARYPLSFQLDDTSYHTTIYLDTRYDRFVPLVDKAPAR